MMLVISLVGCGFDGFVGWVVIVGVLVVCFDLWIWWKIVIFLLIMFLKV